MLLQNKVFNLVLVLISALGYAYFAYVLDRSDFYLLFGLYAVLFFIFVNWMKNSNFTFIQLSYISIGLRLILLFGLPSLSQDFYRFIWDGRMLASGISPYVFTPNQILEQSPNLIYQAEGLVRGMQDLNASHYSNYPPVSQWIYFLAAKVAPFSILGAVVCLRCVLILADVGILYFGKKILQHLNLPIKNIFWFILNPLVILELTGNLHFEGLMLLLLLASIYGILRFKWIGSALFFGLSVATKLLPLVLLPLFYKFHFKKNEIVSAFSIQKIISFSGYSLLCLVFFGLTFIGLADEDFIAHFGESIALWFGTFEFNASLYYVFRWIGFQLVGWNTIATLGKILPVLILASIVYLAFFSFKNGNQDKFAALVLGVSLYFFLSTTVHPWYLATPLLLGVFTRFQFTVIWSFMVMLSYAAYQHEIYHENLWLVALEYVVVLGYLAYELLFLTPNKVERLK